MARRKEYEVGDTLNFMINEKVYSGTINFIASCRKWLTCFPHNAPNPIDPFTKEEIKGDIVVESHQLTPESAAKKKL